MGVLDSIINANAVNQAAEYSMRATEYAADRAYAQELAATAQQNSAQMALQNDAQAFTAQQTAAANRFTARQNQIMRRYNSLEAVKQRAFASGQADKANQFAAEQAKLERDWATEMSNTAWQRGRADLEAAGYNPMLAYMQGGASTPSGQAASASMATGVSASSTSAQGVAGSSGIGNAAKATGFMANTGTFMSQLGQALSAAADFSPLIDKAFGLKGSSSFTGALADAAKAESSAHSGESPFQRLIGRWFNKYQDWDKNIFGTTVLNNIQNMGSSSRGKF